MDNNIPQPIKRDDGTQEWFLNGKLHLTDGPAVIYPDGEKQWWVNGLLHREDGPAIVCADGGEEWWLNGKCHRVDGPAITYPNGTEEWWFDGDKLPFDDWCSRVSDNPDDMAWVILQYG